MPKVIISDTSCLIILTKIGEIDLLRHLYKTVTITQEISLEYGENLPEWFEVQQVKDHYRQQLLEMQIDKGEASAIALALETSENIVILDDWKARKVAERLGLSVTGTLGVIIKAKNTGIIPSIKPYLDKIRGTNFRISEELEQIALKEANEKYTQTNKRQ
jgi:predicted nucleic acid-binding protein